MGNMRFKAGDRVRIKSIDWYNENKDEFGYVRCIDFLFTPEHSKYCGCEFTISHITEFQIPSYIMESNGHEWTDEMIEGLVEEETYDFLKTDKTNRPSLNDFMDMLDNEIKLPEGYEFRDENGNIINATKIVLEKKKKEYPKSFWECCKVLGTYSHNQSIVGYKNELFSALQKLYICRDAYWKIAGDWKPDLLNDIQDKFVLANWDDNIEKHDYSTNRNYILTFPTEEMRDAFYENFKELIEQCKELL